MPHISTLSFIICLLSILTACQPPNQHYCSSQCADYIGACYGTTSNQCYACSQTLYELNSNPTGNCQLKKQHQVYFYQLEGSAPVMDLTGYQSNQPGSTLCDQYHLAGPYVAGNYLEKSFKNIPTNHYQLVIRLGLAYIGSWSQTDQIILTVNGKTHVIQYHHCQISKNLCNAYGNDCIRIINHVVSHESSQVTIKIQSNVVETDTNIKYWGVKDLVIGGRVCHSICLSCFGPTQGQCLTCAPGYFLWGNLCVSKCEFLSIPDQRVCVQNCPIRHFQNDKKECIKCEADCLVCTSDKNCEIWSNDKSTIVWQQNKMFFILLIVLCFLAFVYIFYKYVLRKYWKNKNDQDSDQMNKNMISQSNLQHAKKNKVSDKSSSSNSDQNKSEIKNSQESEHEVSKNEYFDTKNVIFQEHGLNWAAQIPTVQQIMVTNSSIEKKRKKKRFRPTDSSGGPATIELDQTIDNSKL